MDFVIHRHAEIALVFGLLAVGVWWLARRRGAGAMGQRPLTVLCVLIALQGVVGLDQYETHLPTRARLGARRAGLRLLAGMLWAACAAGVPEARQGAALPARPQQASRRRFP